MVFRSAGFRVRISTVPPLNRDGGKGCESKLLALRVKASEETFTISAQVPVIDVERERHNQWTSRVRNDGAGRNGHVRGDSQDGISGGIQSSVCREAEECAADG